MRLAGVWEKALRTYGRTNGRTDGRTDRRRDTPSYRDTTAHLKRWFEDCNLDPCGMLCSRHHGDFELRKLANYMVGCSATGWARVMGSQHWTQSAYWLLIFLSFIILKSYSSSSIVLWRRTGDLWSHCFVCLPSEITRPSKPYNFDSPRGKVVRWNYESWRIKP